MDNRRDRERFLRTLRVTTAAALAEYDLLGEGAATGGGSRFLALAAQSADGWHFPKDGLYSTDGLVLVRLGRDQSGRPQTLELQALGASGMQEYAGRPVAVRLAGLPPIEARFDRDGRGTVGLSGLGVTDDMFASFAVEAMGEA
jgi:hypothetical protein